MCNIIEVTNVTKTFNDKKALKNINLTIKNTGLTALLGPSGSGKSTLLRHLSGLVFADKSQQATIKVFGNVIQKQGKASKNIRQFRSQAGYIFQQFNLVNRMSVLTNVLVGALSSTPTWRALTGLFTQEQKQQAINALRRVGMEEFALQRVSTLSGGQQQRVAIARALMQKAKIIFADEPIASLDPESSRIVMELLQDINQKEGIPVLVTLHQVDHALKYCNEIVALQSGLVFYQGASEALSQAQLTELYRSHQPNTPSVHTTPPLAVAC